MTSLAAAAATVLAAAWLVYREWKGARRMPGFNAATVVEALDWTFEPFVPGAKGTIKEPSDDQISQYLRDFKAMVSDVKGMVPDVAEDADPVDLMSALDDLDPEVVKDMAEKMAGIFAALCSGEPSRETILALPPRRRTMFYGWLQAEVMSPEAVPGGGNGQVRTLRSAAAG